jgi:hypothetical protein
MITQPKPGDFILVHIPGRGGTTIQLLQWMNGTGSDGFEHAAVYIGNDQCIEMSGGGIRVARVADYIRRPHRWSSGILNPSDGQRTDIVAAANHYLELDVDYSWEDYAALTAHRFHIPTPRLKKYIEDTGHMICSQLVDRTWTDGGFHLFDDHRWHGYVTPGHLNQRLGGT